MALVKINDLSQILAETRTALISSTKGDGMLSREDIKNLLEATKNPLKKQFFESFYEFLFKLDYKPRKRITEALIDRGIHFIQEEVIPYLELNIHLGPKDQESISSLHESAFPLTKALFKLTSREVLFSPEEVYEGIEELARGELFFDEFGTEEAQPIEAFFEAYSGPSISPLAFVEALGLEPYIPENEVTYFDSADFVLKDFVDKHTQAGLSNRARAVVELMKENLRDFRVIIFGSRGYPTPRTNYPIYVVGMGVDGNLAGFSSSIFKSQGLVIH